jgi:hypothetical protein
MVLMVEYWKYMRMFWKEDWAEAQLKDLCFQPCDGA